MFIILVLDFLCPWSETQLKYLKSRYNASHMNEMLLKSSKVSFQSRSNIFLAIFILNGCVLLSKQVLADCSTYSIQKLQRTVWIGSCHGLVKN